MTSYVICDSSAVVSLALSIDSNHKLAVKLSKELEKAKNKTIIPSEIFAESINTLGKKVSKEIAVITGNKILNSNLFEIAESSNDLKLLAMKKFEKQPRSVSFTDCIVMALADHYETKEIFGFDEAFQKNGYVRFGIDEARK